MKYKRRLVTVTREDLTSGYQTVQSAHAVADYAMKHPLKFLRWRISSGYLISLSTPTLNTLEEVMTSLKRLGVKYIKFYEDDIKQITAISFVSTLESDIVTSRLTLANSKVGTTDKSFLPSNPSVVA